MSEALLVVKVSKGRGELTGNPPKDDIEEQETKVSKHWAWEKEKESERERGVKGWEGGQFISRQTREDDDEAAVGAAAILFLT